MFKLEEKSVKEDARKIGLTLIGATLLAVSFKSSQTFNLIVAGAVYAAGLILWVYGAIKTEVTIDVDGKQ